MPIIFQPPSVCDHLVPIAPLLEGPWVSLTLAAGAGSLATLWWTAFGRRWRPDGLKRCIHCRHRFPPNADFSAKCALVCNECGRVTKSARSALRRPGRRLLASVAIAATLAFLGPLAIWNSAHIVLARMVLPRWVTAERAEFPNGLQLVRQVDPVQCWLNWSPNPYRGWPDSLGYLLGLERGPLSEPRSRLMTCVEGHLEFLSGVDSQTSGVYCFGMDCHDRPWSVDWTFPSVGEPGFGSGFPSPNGEVIFIGRYDYDSHAWRRFALTLDKPASTVPMLREVGQGYFWRTPANDGWRFFRQCNCPELASVELRDFRAPGLDIAYVWDTAQGQWLPDLPGMHRPVDEETLTLARTEAELVFDECELDYRAYIARFEEPEDQPRMIAEWRAGGSEYDVPCGAMLRELLGGVFELIASGHGTEWESWVHSAWPSKSTPQYRDKFIAEVRRGLAASDCAELIRALPSTRARSLHLPQTAPQQLPLP